MTSQNAVLEAKEVGKEYAGVAALQGVSLEILPGTTVALIGESGSGKTTLLRCFNRLVCPSRGEIYVRGTPVGNLDPITLRRGIGYVPQDGGLLPHWTIERNIALVPKLEGWAQGRREARVDEMLELVGLQAERFKRRYPRDLSGGERQRVSFARALAAQPDVVLLDEPFGALDALTRLELRREYRKIHQDRGLTTLLVTHDISEALQLGTTIAVMKDGIMLQHGTAEALLASPATEYVDKLLSMREWKSA